MKTQRTPFLDILRVQAAFAVVVYHVMKSSISNDPVVQESLRIMVDAIAETLEWHVPIFFMITGYLWLDKKKDCTYERVFHNIRKFVFVLFTIGFCYAVMERAFAMRTISFNIIVSAFGDVLTGDLWDHMWYLYTIIGVYVFLPAVKPFFKGDLESSHIIFLSILFASTIVFPVVEDVFGYEFPIVFPVVTPAFYVCAGGVLAKIQIASRKWGIWGGAMLILSGIIIYVTQVNEAMIRNIQPLLIACATVGLFVGMKSVAVKVKPSALIHSLALCSFGIYVFHPLFCFRVVW